MQWENEKIEIEEGKSREGKHNYLLKTNPDMDCETSLLSSTLVTSKLHNNKIDRFYCC